LYFIKICRTVTKGGLLVLKQAPTPEEIVKLGVEGIIKIWKNAKLRGNEYKVALVSSVVYKHFIRSFTGWA